jgi:SAM-dependent methyltransferase
MEPRAYDDTAEAEQTHWWFLELRRVWRSLLEADALAREGTLKILDAGCGTGGNLRDLETGGNAVAVGVDLSARALVHASRKTGFPLVRASVTALPFRDESFDAVLCTDVLYHAAVTDEAAALREMRRVLRVEGRLVLNVPAFDSVRSSHDRAMHTARRYRRAGLRRLLERAGFLPERLLYWNGILFVPAVLFRLATRRRRTGSDLGLQPGPVNDLLGAIARIDAALALRGVLPAGLSLAALARRRST